jgi:hypothetical protein
MPVKGLQTFVKIKINALDFFEIRSIDLNNIEIPDIGGPFSSSCCRGCHKAHHL